MREKFGHRTQAHELSDGNIITVVAERFCSKMSRSCRASSISWHTREISTRSSSLRASSRQHRHLQCRSFQSPLGLVPKSSHTCSLYLLSLLQPRSCPSGSCGWFGFLFCSWCKTCCFLPRGSTMRTLWRPVSLSQSLACGSCLWASSASRDSMLRICNFSCSLRGPLRRAVMSTDKHPFSNVFSFWSSDPDAK